MKLNTRRKPLILMKFDAIVHRLRPEFSKLKEIKHEREKSKRGYLGEVNVDYYTNFLADQFTILHDICLDMKEGTVQLDTVVITPHAIFIIDSKNYKGTITFDTILEQFTRDDGKVESGYLYPINQLEFQQLKLRKWLQTRGLPNIPIYFFIAISEPSTVIEVIGDRDKVGKVVAHASSLLNRLLDKNEQLTSEAIPEFSHEKIGKVIHDASRDYDKNIMLEYGVTIRDLQPGVQCQRCGRLTMSRIYNNWLCSNCNNCSPHAHKKAIQDYFLLHKPWINNKMCKYWLQLPNKGITTRILKKSNLLYNAKHRYWYDRKKY